MLTRDLFQKVLIEPAGQNGQSRLQIVSGFATASMAHRHLDELRRRGSVTSVDLIVGMANYVGVEKTQHLAFCELVRSQPYGLDFNCRYVVENRPVHAKSYVWLADSGPSLAYCGSANYTMPGFTGPQLEAMARTDPSVASAFYNECFAYTVDCLDEDVLNRVTLTETRRMDDDSTQYSVRLTLLDSRTGETPLRSGINWGQRPGRDPNQAYINIPASYREFFPPRRQQFTVMTDDGYSFILVRAQDGGKGLETPHNNAILGEYLRTRLSVPLGAFVETQHLLDYGRTDVTFIKIDEETFLMDFRPYDEAEHDVEARQV